MNSRQSSLPAAAEAEPILQVLDLYKSFGGLTAVEGVSFDVPAGSIKAVIGPNGAGKTTLFNMIAGSLRPDRGRVSLKGSAITGLKPFQIAGLGVFRTFQNLKLCTHMSVLDNVMLGCHTAGTAGFFAGMLSSGKSRREEKKARERAFDVMESLGIARIAGEETGSLSFGNQRSVELARLLAADPAVLLLDEPAAGLNMHETGELAERIVKIRERDKTVLLVEHDMSLVMEISDEIVVLNFGKKIAEGSPSVVQKNPDVIRIYLGEDDD